MRRKLFVVLLFVAFPGLSFAGPVDIADAGALVEAQITAVIEIGVAVLALKVMIDAFRWFRRSIS